MTDAFAWPTLAAGLVVVVATWRSVLTTLVVPRVSSSRLVVVVSTATQGVIHLLADRFHTWERRDRVLSMVGPSILLVLLIVWLGLFIGGFTLLFWALDGGTPGDAVRLAGSSIFTLGIVAPRGGGGVAATFVAAATGMVVVALQIAYLPVLYAAFNRREQLVTLLDMRAGVPAWGPEILARHQLVGVVDSLPALYLEWERWAADLAETHTSYPPLLFFRSPHPLRSWVTGLLAVLDAAALHHALMPLSGPYAARLVLRMGYTALREIADVLHIPYDPDPHPEDPIALTREEFDAGVRRIQEAGWRPERDLDEAWRHFRGWRVNYEQVAYAIADRLEAPPAPWSGVRRHLGQLVIVPERPSDRRPQEQEEMRREGWARGVGRPAVGYLTRRHRDGAEPLPGLAEGVPEEASVPRGTSSTAM